MKKQYFFKNVTCVIVKDRNLSESKKLADFTSSLEIKTHLNKIPLVGPPLLYMY